MTTVTNTPLLSACPICRSSFGKPFFALPGVPVSIGNLFDSQDDARAIPVGDIELACCEQCQLIVNVRFDPAKLRYSAAYDNSLFGSAVYRDYSSQLAQGLVQRHHLQGKTVMDIGCGQGDFLAMMHDHGAGQCIGFEPCFAENPAAVPTPNGVTIVPTYFDHTSLPATPDAVCSRYVLEHVPELMPLLESVHASLQGRDGAMTFAEVPNMRRALDVCSVWEIIYEHCLYFHRESLSNALAMAGFNVVRSDETYQDQFVTAEALVADSGLAGRRGEFQRDETYPALIEQFATAATRRIAQWNEQVKANKGKTMILWGAGAKGVMLLHLLDDPAMVHCAIDMNPHKRGKYLPRTGHQILSPGDLPEVEPDIVFVSNPVYMEEIGSTLRAMGCDCELFAL